MLEKSIVRSFLKSLAYVQKIRANPALKVGRAKSDEKTWIRLSNITHYILSIPEGSPDADPIPLLCAVKKGSTPAHAATVINHKGLLIPQPPPPPHNTKANKGKQKLNEIKPPLYLFEALQGIGIHAADIKSNKVQVTLLQAMKFDANDESGFGSGLLYSTSNFNRSRASRHDFVEVNVIITNEKGVDITVKRLAQVITFIEVFVPSDAKTPASHYALVQYLEEVREHSREKIEKGTDDDEEDDEDNDNEEDDNQDDEDDDDDDEEEETEEEEEEEEDEDEEYHQENVFKQYKWEINRYSGRNIVAQRDLVEIDSLNGPAWVAPDFGSGVVDRSSGPRQSKHGLLRHDYQTNPKESDRFFHVPRKFTDRWFDEIEVNAKWTLNNKNISLEEYIAKHQIKRDNNRYNDRETSKLKKQYHMEDFFTKTSVVLSEETDLDEVAEEEKHDVLLHRKTHNEDEEDEEDEELFFINNNDVYYEDDFEGDVILDEEIED
jgi:hypothetical protein